MDKKFLGFIRVGAASPKLKVADIDFNVQEILKTIMTASEQKCQLIVFPELCITGYTCNDLFYQDLLIKSAQKAIFDIAEKTREQEILIVLGLPVLSQNKLFNCAAMVFRGKILGIVPKTHLPNTGEFYEKRWFCSANETTADHVYWDDLTVPFGKDLLFVAKNLRSLVVGMEICEDLWAVKPPSSNMAINGATVICNCSASTEYATKVDYRKSLISMQSARCISNYIYASSGTGESSTDLVYSGHSIIAESGEILEESPRFHTDTSLILADVDIQKLVCQRLKNSTFFTSHTPRKNRIVEFTLTIPYHRDLLRPLSPYPFISPKNPGRICEEILTLQSIALAKRMDYTKIKKLVVGISGGLDSTLALLVCIKTLDELKIDRTNITAINMPGMGTSDQTKSNSKSLASLLGVTLRTISIKEAVLQHFKDIGHNPEQHDITFENAQARERTQILMDVANQEQAMLVGTGDLSELALGWCTYNADHMSMYALNSGIPKTLVQCMIKWYSDITDNEELRKTLIDVCETPISPELLPLKEGNINQITEDKVGPYILHDFFLYYHLHYQFPPIKILFLAKKAFVNDYSEKEIHKWLHFFYKRFFTQQYKRSCLPDGPKVLPISLSPRGDWRMSSDTEHALWTKDIKNLE